MFPTQGFTEIVFCAVTSNEQVKVSTCSWPYPYPPPTTCFWFGTVRATVPNPSLSAQAVPSSPTRWHLSFGNCIKKTLVDKWSPKVDNPFIYLFIFERFYLLL